MISDGRRVDQSLRLLRVAMDALGLSVDEALRRVVDSDIQEAVRARWEAERDQPIQRIHSLTDCCGVPTWFLDYGTENGYVWRRLREHLINSGRSEHDVDALDRASDNVLSHLADPRSDGPETFGVRGLVLGYIQSGKTANIAALVAKAADLGYKLVIVLSGLDKGLRLQTQRRLDRELGLRAHPKGVGVPPVEAERWFPLTGDDLDGDFSLGSFSPSAVVHSSRRALAVSKKNTYILRRLIQFLKDAHVADLPVLLVDDEADHASINTGGNRPGDDEEDEIGVSTDDRDPSTINRLIRELLANFRRSAYVAYTATPFANVLIDPQAHDRDAADDLYPRNFIVALPKAPHYIGAERLFGREAFGAESVGKTGLDVVRIIPDSDVSSLLPSTGKKAGPPFRPRMCASLEQAITDFVLATAATEQRLGPGPATMLIHTTQRTLLHDALLPLVDDHLSMLRRRWKYDNTSIRQSFRSHWNSDFLPGTMAMGADHAVDFDDLVPFVNRFFNNPPRVRVLNMTTGDRLDYDADPNLRTIVIGGNLLSRGLTLENLFVSYYVRRTTSYDTLMQMGRWFGYRKGLRRPHTFVDNRDIA